MDLVFEWDPRKDQANLKKHRICFLEAVSAFADPLALIFPDEAHSAEEQREILIGHSRAKQLLLVCFKQLNERRVRIISARRATKREQHDYEDHCSL